MDDKQNILQTQQNISESHITDVETAFLEGIIENTSLMVDTLADGIEHTHEQDVHLVD